MRLCLLIEFGINSSKEHFIRDHYLSQLFIDTIIYTTVLRYIKSETFRGRCTYNGEQVAV